MVLALSGPFKEHLHAVPIQNPRAGLPGCSWGPGVITLLVRLECEKPLCREEERSFQDPRQVGAGGLESLGVQGPTFLCLSIEELAIWGRENRIPGPPKVMQAADRLLGPWNSGCLRPGEDSKDTIGCWRTDRVRWDV